MPTTHAAGTLRGLRISRVPSKPVQREDDGQIAIHLWLRRDGEFDGDVGVLRLAPGEAELLHAQLCYALDDPPLTVGGPRTGRSRRGHRRPAAGLPEEHPEEPGGTSLVSQVLAAWKPMTARSASGSSGLCDLRGRTGHPAARPRTCGQGAQWIGG